MLECSLVHHSKSTLDSCFIQSLVMLLSKCMSIEVKKKKKRSLWSCLMLWNTYYNPCNDAAAWTRQSCNSWGCLTQIQSSILCDGCKAGTLGTVRTGSGWAWDSTQLYLFKRGYLQQPPSPADLLWRPVCSLWSRVTLFLKIKDCFDLFHHSREASFFKFFFLHAVW